MSIRYMLRQTLAALLLLGASLGSLAAYPAQALSFQVQDALIKLANSHYETAFSSTDGSLVYILDKATGQQVSSGNNDHSLWAALFNGGKAILARDEQFNYDWEENAQRLHLEYTGKLHVTVTVTASSDYWLSMQAAVTNNSGATVTGFSFPHELFITASEISDAMLPLMPGALLEPRFFATGRSYVNQYPGVMFADYLAVRSTSGKLALYSQRGAVVQPALIGYERLNVDSPYTKLFHRYRTWLMDAKAWTTPLVYIRTGQNYPETIAAYRTDNRIDKFKSLVEKLGDAAPSYFESALYKFDLAVIKQPFSQIKSTLIDKLRVSGMIHFVVLNSGGMDNNYPVFIPPDPQWGTTSDLADLVDDIHAKGSLVVPYTNLSWWDTQGAKLLELPAPLTLVDVTVIGSDGSVAVEKYGPNVGYVMNLHSDFVNNQIAEQHRLLRQTAHVDGIFEDQWGIRNAPYDLNSNGLDQFDPATSYFEGVLAHYRAAASDQLFTEQGVDVLAENGVGFMGTNYLWDMQGFRSATANVTHYYPAAGMMFRDKVLLYQHDLAAETWTKNEAMLRWNLSQGYNLSNSVYDSEAGAVDPRQPWLTLVGVFQKYALSRYAGDLILKYDPIEGEVRRTEFTNALVYSNWSTERPFTIDGNTLPPGGVITQTKDNSMTAGVFTAYNGHPLSDGNHYLVETRTPDDVKIFQPVGADTDLTVRLVGPATVTAFGYDGALLGAVNAESSGSAVSFKYLDTLKDQAVAFYRVARQ